LTVIMIVVFGVVQYVLFSLQPCPSWAKVFSFYFSLAHVGQTCFDFKLPLPASGKPFIFSIRLCPRRASHLFFHFAFAHVGQACFTLRIFLPASFRCSRRCKSLIRLQMNEENLEQICRPHRGVQLPDSRPVRCCAEPPFRFFIVFFAVLHNDWSIV